MTSKEFFALSCPGGTGSTPCGHEYGSHSADGRCWACKCVNPKAVFASWEAAGCPRDWSTAVRAYYGKAASQGVNAGDKVVVAAAVPTLLDRTCTWPNCGEHLGPGDKTCWKCAARGVPLR